MLYVTDLVKSYATDGHGPARTTDAKDGEALAVDGVSFDVQPGELFTLLGPSGCGKTTTLRSIAGLERPNAGSITLSDRILFDGAGKVDVPANRRNLGMVFQSYAIWPHMTVRDNVSFPFRVMRRSQRPSRATIVQRVDDVLSVVELAGYADRPATNLSGGQQQRLALARAMVTSPALLLLDEPLSNLDAVLRESMRVELKRLQRDLGITSIYVTHDQTEALSLSSRIAVMQSGKIVQLGKPREIYTAPQSRFVAEFIGSSNIIAGTVARQDADEAEIHTPSGTLWTQACGLRPGTDVLLSIRPEAIDLTVEEIPGSGNEWEGTVAERGYLGESVDHYVTAGTLRIRVKTKPSVSIPPGTSVYLHIKKEDVVVVSGGV